MKRRRIKTVIVENCPVRGTNDYGNCIGCNFFCGWTETLLEECGAAVLCNWTKEMQEKLNEYNQKKQAR